jgi:hypothetical protein
MVRGSTQLEGTGTQLRRDRRGADKRNPSENSIIL